MKAGLLGAWAPESEMKNKYMKKSLLIMTLFAYSIYIKTGFAII